MDSCGEDVQLFNPANRWGRGTSTAGWWWPPLRTEQWHGVPIVAQQLTNPTGIHEDTGSIPHPSQGLVLL